MFYLFPQVIEHKECEHKMLKDQLDKAKNDFDEEKNITALKTKEQIMNNISDILETELQCSICSELFIEVCQSQIKSFVIGLFFVS